MNNKILSNNLFLLIILSAIWGSAFLAIKISIESFDPITVASGRLIIASLFLYAYYKFKKIIFKPSIKVLTLIIFIGFIGYFIPFFLISWSEQFIKSNTAGLLMSVGPIFTLILAHFMTHDEKFTSMKLLAVVSGLIGVIFIFGFESLTALFSNDYIVLFPKFTVIVAALGYVTSAILAYNLKHINTIALTTFVTISAAMISIPFILYNQIYNAVVPSKESMIALLYLGIFPTAIGFLLRFYIIAKSGPTFLSFVAYLIPIFAILWGYIFLKETIENSALIGLIFVLIGIYLSQKNTNVENS